MKKVVLNLILWLVIFFVLAELYATGWRHGPPLFLRERNLENQNE
jgi:hypothetical protein